MASANTQTFALSGAVGLKNAPELVVRLRAALEQSDVLVIDADALESIDVAAIQLLVSAHKTALDQGKRLSLRGAPAGALLDNLVKAGFIDGQGRVLTPEAAFWLPLSTTHGVTS